MKILTEEEPKPAIYTVEKGLSPSVNGNPKLILQLEGLAIFITSSVAAFLIGIHWQLYLMLILLPDVFMVGYLMNKKVGAILYNIGHTYLMPLGILASAYFIESSNLTQISLVWFAHIGFDRMLAYGLKYPNGFKSTHLS